MDLYLISPPRQPFVGRLKAVLDAGVDRFQYRRPSRLDYEASRELRSVSRACKQASVPLIVNDRVDLALIHGADGVHVGDGDLPVEEIRNQWPELAVGRTIRDDQAVPGQADYLSLGPVFEPGSKQLELEPCGPSGVRSVLDRVEQPLYVIGGLTPDRVTDLPRELQGVAVIGSVWEAPNPARAVERWKSALEKRD